MPSSPPSASLVRTTPRNRKPAAMVAMARKSSRTRRLQKPTTSPHTPASSKAAGSVSHRLAPAFASSAVA